MALGHGAWGLGLGDWGLGFRVDFSDGQPTPPLNSVCGFMQYTAVTIELMRLYGCYFSLSISVHADIIYRIRRKGFALEAVLPVSSPQRTLRLQAAIEDASNGLLIPSLTKSG